MTWELAMTAIFLQKRKGRSLRSRETSQPEPLLRQDVIYRGFVVTLRVPTWKNETLSCLDLRELRLARLPARHEQRIKYHLKYNLKCDVHEQRVIIRKMVS